MSLQINEAAPKIDGVDFSAGWTLVYFYPADFTPGCTTEACSFRDNFSELSKKVQIIGISADSAESHDKFKEEYKLPFPLISDPDKKLINAYGANGLLFAKRVSFLINPQGIIIKIYDKVDVKKHSNQILSDLNEIS